MQCDGQRTVSENSGRGRFIVFEGLDGSGKSTQIALLAERLRGLGRRVYCTAEPTCSATGGLIRDTLSGLHQRGAAELAALFLTDRIDHNTNPAWGIRKALEDGADVICDRYYYSSFAYQGLGTELDWIMHINLNCPDIMKPDLCVFLDVDHKRCKQRIDNGRAHLEIFEDEDILEQTRLQFHNVFRLLDGMENIRVVDADRSLDEVSDEIYQVVLPRVER